MVGKEIRAQAAKDEPFKEGSGKFLEGRTSREP